MNTLNFDYHYGTEADQYTFLRIPRLLITAPHFKKLSMDAKVLYGLMLDRRGLSMKNQWLDKLNRVYIYFTLDHKEAKAYFNEQKMEKLPTIKMLKQEYAALVVKKKKLYSGYSAARSHMQEILMAQQNVKMLLDYQTAEPSKENARNGR